MNKPTKEKTLLAYATILVLVFYVLPLLFYGNIALLLLVNPLAILTCSIIFASKYNFNILTIIFTGILFLPSIFTFYNDSAMIYAVFYIIISLIGNIIGLLNYKRNNG